MFLIGSRYDGLSRSFVCGFGACNAHSQFEPTGNTVYFHRQGHWSGSKRVSYSIPLFAKHILCVFNFQIYRCVLVFLFGSGRIISEINPARVPDFMNGAGSYKYLKFESVRKEAAARLSELPFWFPSTSSPKPNGRGTNNKVPRWLSSVLGCVTLIKFTPAIPALRPSVKQHTIYEWAFRGWKTPLGRLAIPAGVSIPRWPHKVSFFTEPYEFEMRWEIFERKKYKLVDTITKCVFRYATSLQSHRVAHDFKLNFIGVAC